jgi:hypothetical protein
MDLNAYGAACRCLLRLRENTGEEGISDSSFISRYLSRYPGWAERPGTTDLGMLCELARDLGLADRLEFWRDYDQILREHRAGNGILVYTERVPERVESALRPGRQVMLMVEMNEATFTVWCPYVSGSSETLLPAKGVWWDRWQAIGVVLQHAGDR